VCSSDLRGRIYACNDPDLLRPIDQPLVSLEESIYDLIGSSLMLHQAQGARNQAFRAAI
jgi:hypothetical protein